MRTLLLSLAVSVPVAPCAVWAQSPDGPPVLTIPRLSSPPEFADFLDMDPGDEGRRMARVENFVQRWPDDGQPERMKTVAYVGYTEDALHVVYLAFDPDPAALRAHMIRREDVFTVNDDEVELRVDTYGDRRQSYYFVSNPLGVQLDAAWPEFEGQYDESFDLVWHSRGQRTDKGFVVWMAIPFKSVRFRPGDQQTWGIYFGRWIPRTGEWSFWPRISNRQQSYLAQMARLEGMVGIARGNGVQVVPYVSTRAFRALDTRRGSEPRSVLDRMDPGVGVDAKIVLRDALVLDVAANPDFSQVESDAPQITANQRFEVFFPEKRPFFLENAGFLQTPMPLVFTRRLEDPQFGAKLTGKAGAWTLAGLLADDAAPGRRVANGDPLSGARAWAGIARLSRRLSHAGSIGAIVTRRDLRGRENTVAAVDARFRPGPVWTLEGQWVHTRSTVATLPTDGSAYLLSAIRNGRTVTARTQVGGRSPTFTTDLGFVPRVDVHIATQTLAYTARPAAALNDWGPTLLVERVWAHDGMPLDARARPSIDFNFRGATSLGGFAEASVVTLRQGDAANVSGPTQLRPDTWGFSGSTSPRPWWSASASITAGRAINFAPAGLEPPATADHVATRLTVALRPLTPLRVENTWLRSALTRDGSRVFSTDIFRTRWAWQFTREWSLRLIAQYDDTDADPAATAIAPRRNLNGDVLLTRLLNPWTALYVGYNGNGQNLELVGAPGSNTLRRTTTLTRDSWQVFVKWSHLLRW